MSWPDNAGKCAPTQGETSMTQDATALLPCPFCDGKAEIERRGSHRQSCIIVCGDCGCRLETGEVFSMGERWNTRATSQTPDAVREDQDWNIRKYIDFLRADEGDSVTLLCDNPDFNGQPNCAVECNGYWTNWQDRRFAADTLQGALELAYFECRQWRENPPPEVSSDLRSRVPAEKWTVGKNGWDASDEATREDI